MTKVSFFQIVVGAALLLPVVGNAAGVQAATLFKGQVACISRAKAQEYIQYSKQSSKFAADLLDRAACFQLQEDMEAVLVGSEKGFHRLKLLSGHEVWVSSEDGLSPR